MRLSRLDSDDDPIHCLKEWFRQLEEDAEGMISLQYELIDAILTLRYTRDRDGWSNWDESYHDYLDTLGRWLPNEDSASRIAADLDAIRIAGDSEADAGNFANVQLERITQDVIDWCLSHMSVIALPDDYDFWSDVPEDMVD